MGIIQEGQQHLHLYTATYGYRHAFGFFIWFHHGYWHCTSPLTNMFLFFYDTIIGFSFILNSSRAFGTPLHSGMRTKISFGSTGKVLLFFFIYIHLHYLHRFRFYYRFQLSVCTIIVFVYVWCFVFTNLLPSFLIASSVTNVHRQTWYHLINLSFARFDR